MVVSVRVIVVEVVDTVPLDPTAIVLDDRAWDSAVAPIVEFSQDH